MRGSSTAFRLASAMAAMMSTGRGGNAVLDEMFSPKFNVAPPLDPRYMPSPGKHRNSGRTVRTYRGGNMTAHCGHKQTAKYARQVFHPVHHNFDERMAWLARNQHVLEKRAADQERAAGPSGGRNAIQWGRK